MMQPVHHVHLSEREKERKLRVGRRPTSTAAKQLLASAIIMCGSEILHWVVFLLPSLRLEPSWVALRPVWGFVLLIVDMPLFSETCHHWGQSDGSIYLQSLCGKCQSVSPTSASAACLILFGSSSRLSQSMSDSDGLVGDSVQEDLIEHSSILDRNICWFIWTYNVNCE